MLLRAAVRVAAGHGTRSHHTAQHGPSAPLSGDGRSTPCARASHTETRGRPRHQPPRCMRPGRGSRRAHAAARAPARPPFAHPRPRFRPAGHARRARSSSGRSAQRANLRARGARPRSVSGSKVMCLGVLRRLGDVDARLARRPVARSRRAAASRQRMQHGTFCMRVEAHDRLERGANGMRARIGRWFGAVASTHLDERVRVAGAEPFRERARAGHPSHARSRKRASGPRAGPAGIAWASGLSSATRWRPPAAARRRPSRSERV
jgi:hypothetical protein